MIYCHIDTFAGILKLSALLCTMCTCLACLLILSPPNRSVHDLALLLVRLMILYLLGVYLWIMRMFQIHGTSDQFPETLSTAMSHLTFPASTFTPVITSV